MRCYLYEPQNYRASDEMLTVFIFLSETEPRDGERQSGDPGGGGLGLEEIADVIIQFSALGSR